MRPKRSLLGQIFLRDTKYIKKILNSLKLTGETVLEIGPGDGVFTNFLSFKAKKLWAVEFDKNLSKNLKDKFLNNGKVEIIQADILKFSLSRIGKKLVIFGNAPYQISRRLIEYLIANRKLINRAYLMFQKEFAAKLLAKPQQAQYGFLSCYLQYYAKVGKAFDIPAKAFKPKPKVNSSFVEIDFYSKSPHKVKDEKLLFRVINKAFNHRRKKLSSSLGIASDLRPQQVSLENYCRIADYLI